MSQQRLRTVRECYEAYESGDRDLIDRHLSADFTFYSPPDPGIDRETYFERCWPNAKSIAGYDFKRLVEIGEEVLVTYEAERLDGTRFCNTEILAFTGEKLAKVEVYFGWNLPSS